jgi:transcriptional regulator with XRE-family HTH domain
MPKLNTKLFQKLRNERFWTLADVARRAGVGFGTPSKWERGLVNPHRRMIERLAEIFNVSAEELIEANDQSQEQP